MSCRTATCCGVTVLPPQRCPALSSSPLLRACGSHEPARGRHVVAGDGHLLLQRVLYQSHRRGGRRLEEHREPAVRGLARYRAHDRVQPQETTRDLRCRC
uniref:Uncharacterized protein n=1 Tax=Coconut foliar decay virus TaxID=12474 RepID=A0A2R4N9E0_9VIRU|nr:hypothetical protein [Coconut foliar decay virus]AVX29457.1 hypothetical protein [Coconut foliar decay virus]AVX29461.1 hypothetical protein [Coconut foliar decay virus]